MISHNWSPMKRLIWLRGSGITGGAGTWETISGNPVSFTAKAAPLRQLEVAFSPVQDLHGYDAPWPAGGGKNKFDKTAITDFYYLDADGNPVSNSSWSISDYISLSGTITISGYGDGGSAPRSCWYDANKAFISSFQLSANQSTVAVPSGAVYARFSVRHNNLDTVQIELGSTPTSYAPYSNECPISGWSSLTVEQRGKNLFPVAPAYADNGTVLDKTKAVRVFANRQYHFSFDSIGTATKWRLGVKVWDLDGNIVSESPYTNVFTVDAGLGYAFNSGNNSYYNGADTTVKAITYTFKRDCWVKMMFGSGDTSSSMTMTDAMYQLLATGETPAPYAPYNGRSISITFPAMGANQWDEEWENARINLTTGEIASGNGLLSKNLIPAVPNTQYHAVSGSYTGGSSFVFAYYDADGNYLNYEVKFGMSVNFTTPANAGFIRFNIQTSEAVTYNHDIAINYPSSVTTYSPYTNTVYSGYVDLVTGVGEITHGIVDLGTLRWTDNGVGTFYTASLNGRKKVGGDDCVCSALVKAAQNTSLVDMPNASFRTYANSAYIVLKLSGMTAENAQEMLSGFQLVYPLATPITIQLTPQEVESLAGDNTMWTDAASLEVTYRSN